MKRCPTTAHSPPRSISVSMRSARLVPSRARALSRPARLPIRLATIAVPTAAPSVTKMPNTGPNRIPLPAARIAPGTNNEPSTADATTYTSGAAGPVAAIARRTASMSMTRATATR
ncbi:Uncharacterised protein [Mycobacterium tuberculosis]|nr:Uncharacterised protein [Mycobacterium tuberculosis]